MVAINGFSVSSSPSYLRVKSFRVPGTSTYLPVRSEIAPLLIGLAAEFHRTVEPLVRGWCWGYAYRPVTGGRSPSFHSAGIAIDLNAPRHPYGRRHTFSAGDATRCRALARKYGCRWGGDYRTNADEMHFEIIVPRLTALVMARKLQTTVTRHVYLSKLEPGVRDSATVKHLQRELNRRLGISLTVDGDYGPVTKQAVKRWEARQGWTADGDIGKPGAARIFADRPGMNYVIHP